MESPLSEATHERHELPVMSFCGCRSAEALIAGGRLDDAERELARALQVANIRVKLGLHNRSQAAALAHTRLGPE
jgi:hypothetical protein